MNDLQEGGGPGRPVDHRDKGIVLQPPAKVKKHNSTISRRGSARQFSVLALKERASSRLPSLHFLELERPDMDCWRPTSSPGCRALDGRPVCERYGLET